jgi:hypothetical protein
VHRELAGLDHLTQFLECAQAVLTTQRVVRFAVDAEAGAQVLGVVYRDVGAAQERGDLQAVLGEQGDADTRSHPHRDAVDGEGR